MTSSASDGIATVLAAAEQGATILTANKRSSRTLLDAFARKKHAQDERAWRTPDIVSWDGFVLRMWNDLFYSGAGPGAILLNDSQERRLWEQAVGPDCAALLNPGATAEKAAEAWRLLAQYAIPLESPLYKAQAESAAFAEWAAKFEGECRRGGWVDSASLGSVLLAYVGTGQFAIRRRMMLVGFDHLTPQQQALLNALRDAGADIQRVEQLSPAEAAACVVAASDEDEEIRAAATWARRKLEADPAAKIGVVVPSLEPVRRRIQSIFLATMHPEQVPAGAMQSSRAFEISLGVPLAGHPLVATALLVLKLASSGLSLTETGSLLRSPFLAGAETELTVRARLDATLRKKRVLEVTVERLWDEAGLCPVLRTGLTALREVQGSLLKSRSPREWSEALSALLQALGWPEGERGLNSEEYQAAEAWTTLLSEFGSLENVETAMAARRFLSLLSDCVAQATFEPEKLGAPVQITGILEAAGSSFDCMWIMGLHDGAWPARSAATPFIPAALQRERGVPQASPEMQLEFAVKMRDRLLHSAAEVVFSYPATEGDTELRPSPLLDGYEMKPMDEVVSAHYSSLSDTLFACAGSESLCDETGPSIAEGTLVKGGTRILEMQSACPFRAFFELRLGAKEMESPQPGLDNRQRGNIVHKALEFLWGRLKTHDGLQACELLPDLVFECVGQAIADADAEGNADWERSLAAIERERVTALILELLEYEKQRAPFSVIESEQQQSVALGGLQMHVKVDRMDRLNDGSLALIDYKTGAVDVKSWEGERPEQPQLPAYAATAEGKVTAVAFAQIKAGEVGFCGYSPNEEILFAGSYAKTQPGKTGESLQQVIARWHATLERLAREHRDGRAEVDPAEPNKTCKYCPLPGICRISQDDVLSSEEQGDEE
jgi:ATP-dependent helicase/nuclease subunit B